MPLSLEDKTCLLRTTEIIIKSMKNTMFFHQKYLLNLFNKPDTLAVLTSYPNRGELYSTGKSGVASYAKNVVSNMRNKTIVFCEYDTSPEIYREKNTLVVRCFKNGSVSMYAELAEALRAVPNVKKLLVQYDFSLYGGMINNAVMIGFLAMLRMIKYDITMTLHHVVTDIRKLHGHVGLDLTHPYDQMKADTYNNIFQLFYKSLPLATNRIVVLEEFLREDLSKYLYKESIVTIPHGVDTRVRPIGKDAARRALGFNNDQYIITFFGYINWFKGADEFVRLLSDTQKILGKKVRFVIAGGKSPTLAGRAYYETYYAQLMQKARSMKNLTITGYVPQSAIRNYMGASDLLVLPYRHLMTASGALSLIFSHGIPFIVSEAVDTLLETHDIKDALLQTGLSAKDLSFALNAKSLRATIESVLKNGKKAKSIQAAGIIAKARSYSVIGKLYERVIFAPQPELVPQPQFGYTKSI